MMKTSKILKTFGVCPLTIREKKQTLLQTGCIRYAKPERIDSIMVEEMLAASEKSDGLLS